MNITLTGKKISQDTKFLAFEKNNNVDVINITVDTDESWTYKLDVKYPEKCCSGEQLYNIINLTRTGNVCTAILTSDMLSFAGKYTMQIRGINGDKVYHSDTFDAWVKYSIEPASTYDPVPSEFYQIEANVTEMNNNPPYPSDDGYWMIWDVNTHAYKKSDIKIIDGLPEISESTKDMALYNDGKKAEWREQRNPIPDYQENDPESPNYIRNRNGGYYEQGEQFLNAVYPFNNFQIPVAYKNDNPVVCVNVNDTDGTKTFWKAFSYFCEKGNLETVGFYLRYTGPVANGNEQYSYILEYKDGTKSVRMYDATPVIWPSDFIPIAKINTAGVVRVGNELQEDYHYGYSDTAITPEGAIVTPMYMILVNTFEWSQADGPTQNGQKAFYYETVSRGWILKSSNYLMEKLGIASADFPIQIISEGSVYGSGVPYMNCVFSTKTGKTGEFAWRFTGSVIDSYLNDSSDIFVVRFTQDGNTWSADKSYTEIEQALTDGKVVQGVANGITAIAIDQTDANNVEFRFDIIIPDVQANNIGAIYVSVLDIIVAPDGTTGTFTDDYRSVIAPTQTITVIKNNDDYISKLVGPIARFDDPLTYIVKFISEDKLAISSLSTLTVLFGENGQIFPSRYYYSNIVMTRDSATSSIKIDFVFKSADATKTLTGSVTMPKGWDGETPLAETWTYTETDALDGAVRYDEAQSLTDAQKQQARDNIGVVDVPIPTADNVGKVPVAAAVDKDTNTYGYEMKDLADPRVTIFHVTGRNPMAMDITLDELNAAITAGNVVFAIRATGQDANPELVYRYQETRTYTYSADSTSTKHVFVCVTKPEAETVVLKNTPTLEVLCVNVNTGFIQRSSVYAAKVLDVAVNNTNGQLKTTVPVQYISAAATSGVFNAVLQVRINGNNTTPYEIYQVVSSGTSGTSPNYVTTVKCARYDGGKLYELTFTGPLSSTDANDTVVTKTEMTVLPAPATGTVGQLIKVKAADTYGNITETETVDDTLPTPSAENVGKIPVSKQVGDGYKYVMEDKSTSDLSLGITGASTGQSPIINAVDAAGKPTAWGAALLAKADGSNIPTDAMDAWRTRIAALPGIKVYGKADANGKIKAYIDAACTEEATYLVLMALADYGNALLIYDHKTYQCVGFDALASMQGDYLVAVFFRSEIATDSAGTAVLKVETAKLNVLDYQTGAINAPITITAGELPLTTTTTT